MKIAILGWGSLLWDPKGFDKWHEDWLLDGPLLPLEFSRISKTRNKALTLVIDIPRGEECCVAYAMSKRKHIRDAVCDLLTREGTSSKNIGLCCVKKNIRKSRNPGVPVIISTWMEKKEIDAVIWTDLGTSFSSVRKEGFISTALAHIQKLTSEGKTSAAEYMWRAPDFVSTPLRRALEHSCRPVLRGCNT